MPQKGKLQFTDVTVDPATGAVQLRAIFPNPDRHSAAGPLCPRHHQSRAWIRTASWCRRPAVGHDPKGEPTVLVVDDQEYRAPARAQDRPRRRRQLAGAGRPQARRQGDRARAWHKVQPDMPVPCRPRPARRQARARNTARSCRCRASSSTARSSPGSSPSSSCWRAASPPSACRSSNIPPSPRPRWRSAPSIPAPTPQSLQNSVTQVIEQQLTGLDNLLYFSSSSNADGTVHDHRHLRARHQSRHRPGAGAEQGAGGGAAAAQRRCSSWA